MSHLDAQAGVAKMEAAIYIAPGGPEVVEIQEVDRPVPSRGEVLIEVAAAGLNRADVSQRMGNYPPPAGASEIPGLEVSGTIVGRGTDVSPAQWPDGMRVCALLAGGGYAQYVAVPVGQVMEVPDGYDLIEAAGMPEVTCTVLSNFDLTAPVKEGDWVLVHGGSGGIGTFALQYLKTQGARTITTCSTPEKERWAKDHGADFTINYPTEDFAQRVLEITDGHGADVILDVVGAKYLEQNVESLADGGRLVTIGLVGGAKGELNLRTLLQKRAGVIATSLRTRSERDKARIVELVREKVWPLIIDGSIEIPIDRVFSLDQAKEAQEYFDSGNHTGKVLLEMLLD